jgi:predicted enzyme related to lactoylglutathione lyase
LLARVTLLVSDYDAALSFFADGLGWACVEDRDEGRKRWVVVAPPGGGAELVLARPTTPAQDAALGAQAGDRVGFFLTTDDFDATADRIRAAGGTFLEPPRKESYGRVAQWRDPWGNRWDLIQP